MGNLKVRPIEDGRHSTVSWMFLGVRFRVSN